MSATLSYVFCLTRRAGRPVVRGVAGMPGGTDLRAIEVGERLWAIVQTVPAAGYNEAAIASGLQAIEWVSARALAHEHVTERFLSAEALLPMQLFTLFTSDERVVEHVRADRPRIASILKRLDRKVEWGVRLTWDEKSARETVERKHAGSPRRSRGSSAAALGAKAGAAKAGSAYLARKRDIQDVNKVQLAAAREEASRLYKKISREAAYALRRTSVERAAPGSRLLLDAAFLVPASKTAAFRAALRKHALPLRGSGVAVALTGPWPAYNFVDPPPRKSASARQVPPSREGTTGDRSK